MGIAKAGLSRAVGILALTTMVLQALSLPLLPCYAQGASTGMAASTGTAPSGPPDA